MQMCEIGRDLFLSLQNNQIIDNLAIHIINNLARYIAMDVRVVCSKEVFPTSVCITLANKIVETQTLYKLSI